MNKLKNWKFIYHNLSQGIDVVLLYVLESIGSSPGRQGFFMAINAKNELCGSIGGGIMEHKFVELAKEILQKREQINQIKKQIHNKTSPSNQSGMICSGEQTFFIYKIHATQIEIIDQIIYSLEKKSNGSLIILPSGISFSEVMKSENYFYNYVSEKEWKYVEKLDHKNKLFIIGGGHCALALSNLMATLDFDIQLFDNRADLNTLSENKSAHKIQIIEDYTALKSLIPSGKQHFVVIMTVGYRSDLIALKAIIHKELKYLGLLGSKAKIKTLFDELIDEGIEQMVLKKVHAPIGINIKSETPEEIAISIAAEIIQVKNKTNL